MIIKETEISGLCVIIPRIFQDERGWFSETYNESKLSVSGKEYNFIQDNHSFSRYKGTLRGLHIQINPCAQTKLVRCTRGRILDVAVDLRVKSATYLKAFSIELSDENKYQLLIPKGFAHGFVTLEDNVEVQYKVDNYYSKEHDRSIRYDDSLFKINWLEKRVDIIGKR